MATDDQHPSPDDLWEQMVAEARAAFALAMASNDAEVCGDREQELVDAAITAGVVGALEVIRHKPDCYEPPS